MNDGFEPNDAWGGRIQSSWGCRGVVSASCSRGVGERTPIRTGTLESSDNMIKQGVCAFDEPIILRVQSLDD